ncbi:MAG TPA: CehA/McbA family metallohydrolase [Bryobacteraceae bacterium]|nr:CehA/McbA family metallohydrolase [Bryobacteraceae bacterium]
MVNSPVWRVRSQHVPSCSLLLRVVLAAFLACLPVCGQAAQSSETAEKHWYKGNLHTHTLNSDGDSTPDEVVTWYREQRYNFLVLTDHNYLTDIAGLNAVHGARDKFILVSGEEVSDRFEKKPIHLNAYKPSRLVEPQHGDSVASVIQNNVDEIRKADGVPALNHPNFGWAVSVEDMLAVKGLGLFEVYNGHPMVNNDGGGGFKSLDEMWDALLTAGQTLYGIAVDDAHHFKRFGKEFSNPGHGWVVVRAESLTSDAVVGALTRGDFFATTGVRIGDISTGPAEYRIQIETADWERVTTYFIGAGGKVLDKVHGNTASYRYNGSEQYVRARVESSSGAKAWTQPVFKRR